MQSEIISLKSKLNQKEEALAEIVDEIVYFENHQIHNAYQIINVII